MRDDPVLILGVLLPLALLSAATVALMIGRGVLDVPGARSSHDRPVPKGGGVGIVVAWVAGFAFFAVTRAGTGVVASAGLIGATVSIATVAWFDDVRQFGFAPKLAAQFASGALVVACGWRFALPMPAWAADIVTLGWILFATNALNFIDGLNGLASGSALIVSAAMGIASLRVGNAPLAAVTLPLAAGIAGFLPFNLPPAPIFLGDVGSQACGLLLAVAATRTGPGICGALAVPLALLAILVDVGGTLVRRFLAGDRLTEAHRGHLYQLAHRAGMSVTTVTPVYWLLAAIGSLGVLVTGERPAIATVTAASFALWSTVAIRTARRSAIGRW